MSLPPAPVLPDTDVDKDVRAKLRAIPPYKVVGLD
jgi:hypothetical protein